MDWLLVLWMGLEVGGYFMLTPFPAVRRIMGISVVGTLLAGRLAARTCGHRSRTLLVRTVVAGGIGLALAFYGVDLWEALAQKQAARKAAERLRQQSGTVWYVGHWGFQYYAERAGMKPVVPGTSRLCKGDWLVVPDERVCQQAVHLNKKTLELVHQLIVDDPLPVRTVAGYYGSRIPLETHEGPRVALKVYRATADCILLDGP